MSKTIGLSKITKKYAEALFQLVSGNASKEKKVLSDLLSVEQTFSASLELRLILDHPNVKLDDKRSILSSLFSKVIESEVLNTLLLLLERRRTGSIPNLAAAYKEIYFASQNIEVAKVSSAKDLSKEQLNQIKERLEKIFAKNLELESELDEKLIAGIRVRVGDKVLDSSVRAKLKQMKQLLTS